MPHRRKRNRKKKGQRIGRTRGAGGRFTGKPRGRKR